MNNSGLPECCGVIPARYASSRFPGKPLAEINGKPMFWHVYTRALQCPELNRVVIATDDERIASNARDLDVPVIMTRNDHESGTDRVHEAATRLNIEPHEVIVNIQGDEPLLDPAMLSLLIRPFADARTEVTTLAHRLEPEDAENPDRVKVAFAPDGRALYFSRAPIPHPRDKKDAEYFCHIGLYAFRRQILDQFVRLTPGRLEQIEKLEQLRLLENGITIRVELTESKSISVDRPEDLKKVIEQMQRKAQSHDPPCY
ncbi:MAG: 3-deoxy-manno-octulosonate cytidylyltransferase [Desulfobacteraceae bacterium]|nr:3-deoxy-manno-octulosonate cytidylyltransferase [Desulfobacteraceae bacterium]MCF8095522.1 3-deoxy-manno-octulosonate cytidylyltransferase [Desulfobacteraceae bacterium]